jgi:hypothetical protein
MVWSGRLVIVIGISDAMPFYGSIAFLGYRRCNVLGEGVTCGDPSH